MQPYGTNDAGGFNNIAPPGSSGFASGPEIAAFLTSGARPPHNDEQLSMYGDLVYAAPGLKPEDLRKYYKDATFGVKPEDVERQYTPRDDVTIVRDKQFGVPHVYGTTRPGVMFGAGYAAAEDRLFFIDVLRHLGRAQLSSFAGGAQGNRDFDREQWSVAPYTEEDLQKQVDQFDDLYGDAGRQIQDDVKNYVEGVNAYIAEAKINPLKMPGEYAAINQPGGPDEWTAKDVIAIAGLVGAIFGKGGGGELDSYAVLEAARARFGRRAGRAVWADFRSADDPEAFTSVFGKRFPYETPPKKRAKGSLAVPDKGSLEKSAIVAEGAAAKGDGGGILPRSALTSKMSNALIVSAKESETGRPIAVFGPQTGYFAPQILMEQDLHGPGIDARGVAFPGTNLYVQLGRGRDYAWSATSAGQDIIDTFALPLCEPDGKTPTLDSQSYEFRGKCTPIEVLERENSWAPSAADQTPPGSEKLRAERTALGIVTGRATVKGKPVIYTKLRSTYFHEVDSAIGISAFNNPDLIKGPKDFQRYAYGIGYTFNWYYIDSKNTAYMNSGNNPVRARGIDPNFPTWGSFEWRGYDPANWTARYTPISQHPQTLNQQFNTDWNNKQARGYRSADDEFSFTSEFRVERLADRVKKGIRGRNKMNLIELIDAMEDGGTVDLRGAKVLPSMLAVLGAQKDPDVADAIAKLKAWTAGGAHRRDRDRNGTYDESEAVQIMDAWWPLWVKAQFEPALGPDLYKRIEGVIGLDNAPNNHGEHLGSAYQAGWYGFASKDLRRLRGRRVKGAYSRVYCGARGTKRASMRTLRKRCRADLLATLKEALEATPEELYEDDVCKDEGMPNNQWCFDSVRHRPLGAITQPLIHWIDRPTFQQAVEVQKALPR